MFPFNSQVTESGREVKGGASFGGGDIDGEHGLHYGADLRDGGGVWTCEIRTEILHEISAPLTRYSFSIFSQRSSLSSLKSSLRQALSELFDPHCVITAQTLQLNNLHSTSVLIQSTIRILRLV
ncbi:unnamed protein product [Fraxinus pennsylvanica]|uniref:Uncharacterized protein n=1 Tax=Fraxinus pennsylvanica TaxID=56036 RepID=A0AAD2E3R0_9LAMI|nr:unnamed protein product [Fraxinus pennsylvanica]